MKAFDLERPDDLGLLREVYEALCLASIGLAVAEAILRNTGALDDVIHVDEADVIMSGRQATTIALDMIRPTNKKMSQFFEEA